MSAVRYLMVILLVVLSSACTSQSAKSLPDNQENRTAVAKRYLEAMPPKEMLQEVAGRVGPHFPENERQVFMEVMKSPAIEKAAYRITLGALVKNFTVAELNAMLAFYGSPEGRSANKKFPAYMGQTIPQIQQEVKKAIEVAQKQPEPQKPQDQPKSPGKQEQKAPPAQK